MAVDFIKIKKVLITYGGIWEIEMSKRLKVVYVKVLIMKWGADD